MSKSKLKLILLTATTFALFSCTLEVPHRPVASSATSTLDLNNTLSVYAEPNLPKPPYLKNFTDPVFHTKVTRITGNPGQPIPVVGDQWPKIARHNYSIDPVWNADQSLIYLERVSSGSSLFLDGNTYKPLFTAEEANTPYAESRWHPKKPDVMIYMKDNIIGSWNVWARTTKVIKSFPGYSNFTFGAGDTSGAGGEGNLSLNGNRVVVSAIKNSTGKRVAFAYDIGTRTKFPDISLRDIDGVTISPLGNYVVTSGNINGYEESTKIYDLQGNTVGIWTEYGLPSHYDLTVDNNGDEVAVGSVRSGSLDGNVIKRRLRDGKVTSLLSSGYAIHTSTRNIKRPGWAYVTYPGVNNWKPFQDEIVAVKLDGSQQIERLGHIHSGVGYEAEAHAVPSPDGKRVIFASSWGASSEESPVSAYIIDVRLSN